MSEFEDKLNGLLSNPESMAQIMQLAQSLSGSSSPAGSNDAPPPSPQPEAPPPFNSPPPNKEESTFDPSCLFENFDPQILSKLLPLFRELNSPRNSQREQLLQALRPFLKPERQANIQKALQISKLLHAGKIYLLERRGNEHV